MTLQEPFSDSEVFNSLSLGLPRLKLTQDVNDVLMKVVRIVAFEQFRQFETSSQIEFV